MKWSAQLSEHRAHTLANAGPSKDYRLVIKYEHGWPTEQRAHGVVASHPLRMRKALGSNPSVSNCYAPSLQCQDWSGRRARASTEVTPRMPRRHEKATAGEFEALRTEPSGFLFVSLSHMFAQARGPRLKKHRPRLEPGISGSGRRRLVHQANNDSESRVSSTYASLGCY
jgi:hypothetical protein